MSEPLIFKNIDKGYVSLQVFLAYVFPTMAFIAYAYWDGAHEGIYLIIGPFLFLSICSLFNYMTMSIDVTIHEHEMIITMRRLCRAEVIYHLEIDDYKSVNIESYDSDRARINLKSGGHLITYIPQHALYESIRIMKDVSRKRRSTP